VNISEISPRLHELLTAAAEGELGDADAGELSAMLRSEADVRQLYADYMSVHALLSWRHGGVPPLEMPLGEVVQSPPARPRKLRRWLPWASVAAVLVAATFAARHFLRESPEPAAASPDSIAVVVEQRETKFDSGESLATDEWLEAGRHRLSEGSARIALTNGVNLALEGPLDFELASPERMHLSRGRVRVYVPVAARGFTITTSRGVQIVDLGTDFGVAVDAEQNVDVFVYAGSVVVNGKSQLAAGESLRITAGGEISAGNIEEIARIPTLHMP
jgi:hypothetical protein